MRIAVAGMGLRAGHVLRALLDAMPEARVAGYHDPTPTPRHLDKIGGDAVPAYDGVEAMLEDARPDLFCIFSPNAFHMEHLEAGFESGTRIFVEKPVTTSVADSLRLARLLAERGTDSVMVGLVLRHSSLMTDMREAIAAGMLGPVASMEGCEHIAPWHGAFFMRDWRRHSRLSGGFMLEKCCHDIDVYNMIAGCRPLRVASFGSRRSFLPEHAPGPEEDSRLYHSKESEWMGADDPFASDGDIVDCQTAMLEYESGACLSFHTNMNSPEDRRRFLVVGARGTAEGDFVRGRLKVTDARTRKVLMDRGPPAADRRAKGHYGADAAMAADLAAFLRGENRDLPVSAIDAIEAGIAALAIDEARLSGRVIDLAETWKELDALEPRR